MLTRIAEFLSNAPMIPVLLIMVDFIDSRGLGTTHLRNLVAFPE